MHEIKQMNSFEINFSRILTKNHVKRELYSLKKLSHEIFIYILSKDNLVKTINGGHLDGKSKIAPIKSRFIEKFHDSNDNNACRMMAKFVRTPIEAKHYVA